MSFYQTTNTTRFNPRTGRMETTRTTQPSTGSSFQDNLSQFAKDSGATDKSGKPFTDDWQSVVPESDKRSFSRRFKDLFTGKKFDTSQTSPTGASFADLLNSKASQSSVSVPRAAEIADERYQQGQEDLLSRISGALGVELGQLTDLLTGSQGSGSSFPSPSADTGRTVSAPSSAPLNPSSVHYPPSGNTTQTSFPTQSTAPVRYPSESGMVPSRSGISAPEAGTSTFREFTTRRNGQNVQGIEVDFTVHKPASDGTARSVAYNYKKQDGTDGLLVISVMKGTPGRNEIIVGGGGSGRTSNVYTGTSFAPGTSSPLTGASNAQSLYTPRSDKLPNNPAEKWWDDYWTEATTKGNFQSSADAIHSAMISIAKSGPDFNYSLGGAIQDPSHIEQRRQWMNTSCKPIIHRYDFDGYEPTQSEYGLIEKHDALNALTTMASNLADLAFQPSEIHKHIDEFADHLGLRRFTQDEFRSRMTGSRFPSSFGTSGGTSGLRSGVSGPSNIPGKSEARKIIRELPTDVQETLANPNSTFRVNNFVDDWAVGATSTTRKPFYDINTLAGGQYRKTRCSQILDTLIQERDIPNCAPGTDNHKTLLRYATFVTDNELKETTDYAETQVRETLLRYVDSELDAKGWKKKGFGTATTGGTGSILGSLFSGGASTLQTVKDAATIYSVVKGLYNVLRPLV